MLPLNLSVVTPTPLNITAQSICVVDMSREYEGAYEFTPTQETQTIEIANKKATQNIIINPIPNNYGLITWNGAFLTVS